MSDCKSSKGKIPEIKVIPGIPEPYCGKVKRALCRESFTQECTGRSFWRPKSTSKFTGHSFWRPKSINKFTDCDFQQSKSIENGEKDGSSFIKLSKSSPNFKPQGDGDTQLDVRALVAIEEVPNYLCALTSVIDDVGLEAECSSIPLFPYMTNDEHIQKLSSLHGQAKEERVRPPDSSAENHDNENDYDKLAISIDRLAHAIESGSLHKNPSIQRETLKQKRQEEPEYAHGL